MNCENLTGGLAARDFVDFLTRGNGRNVSGVADETHFAMCNCRPRPTYCTWPAVISWYTTPEGGS